jgi:hypothetical protein
VFVMISKAFYRISRLLSRVEHELTLHSWLLYLRLANRFSRLPITQSDGAVVSLTTYGKRAQSAHLAIESIGQGETRPSRIILWLDDVSLIRNLPRGLRRLQKRGLEVRLCENYGPHKKYYPYLESLHTINTALVTADDDVLYPRSWLKRLVEAFEESSDVINCHRARRITLDEHGIDQYCNWGGVWDLVESTKPSCRQIAIGVAGVIYPVQFQRALKREGAAFVTCCPTADDIWLHVQAIRAGYKVRQIRKATFRLFYIPDTQGDSLCRHNVACGGNDRQIAATYRMSDIALLRNGE